MGNAGELGLGTVVLGDSRAGDRKDRTEEGSDGQTIFAGKHRERKYEMAGCR